MMSGFGPVPRFQIPCTKSKGVPIHIFILSTGFSYFAILSKTHEILLMHFIKNVY